MSLPLPTADLYIYFFSPSLFTLWEHKGATSSTPGLRGGTYLTEGHILFLENLTWAFTRGDLIRTEACPFK